MNIRQALIIEDEFDIYILLEAILKLKNINSIGANNINDAKEILENTSPDFIFLDHKLPDGWGFDIIPYLRNRCPQSIIIGISGEYEFLKGVATCNNADHFITKPFAIENIFSLLDKNIQ